MKEHKHTGYPDTCPMCREWKGGDKLLPGEKVKLHPRLAARHWFELDVDSDSDEHDQHNQGDKA